MLRSAFITFKETFVLDTNNEILLILRKEEDLFYKSVVLMQGEKRLHPEVEQFIIEKVKNLQRRFDFQISIQIQEASSFDRDVITPQVRQHFVNKQEKELKQVRRILNLGTTSLLIAFAFLIIMYLLTNAMTSLLPENAVVITFRELFIILAWVALWRPAELLLYEWRPHQQNANLFKRIATCKVKIIV